MKSRINFIANSCHVCKTPNPDIACEICGLIFYCSSSHRIEHWQSHSHLCRAVHKLCQKEKIDHLFENAVGSSSETFRIKRHKAAAECAQLLGRELQSWELEIIYYPRVCNVCYKMFPAKLTPCTGCQYILTCSNKHFKKQHKEWCSALKFYCDIVKFLQTNDIPFVQDVAMSGKPTTMSEVMALQPSLKATELEKHEKIVQAFVSDVATYPLTILQALDMEKATLTIHLVGAELQAEVLPFNKWEIYLLHLLPTCQKLHLVFVGPDLQPMEQILSKNVNNIPLCLKCRNAGKCLSYELILGMLYHDYQNHTNKKTCDLLTAFNSGLYRSTGFQGTDSWFSTLKCFFAKDSPPLLVTEYTLHELQKDQALIKERFPEATFMIKPSINNFASIKPSLNIISDGEIPVIFRNYYYMIVYP